jgi:hypothetical protein
VTPPTYRDLRASMPHGEGECSYFAHTLRRWIDGDPKDQVNLRLDIDPDYQRGHIWTEAQSAAFVGHKLEGGECPTITIQRWDTNPVDEVVDGKQRILAVLGFVEGRVPALLSDGNAYFLREWGSEDQRLLPRSFELMLRGRIVKCATRADVLRLYLRLNRGGSIHSDEEIARVRALLSREAA